MKKENAKLTQEIQKIREQLYDCINKNGINDEPSFISLNNRLDELIVQWIKNSQ